MSLKLRNKDHLFNSIFYYQLLMELFPKLNKVLRLANFLAC
jgi:hypothetical protein